METKQETIFKDSNSGETIYELNFMYETKIGKLIYFENYDKSSDMYEVVDIWDDNIKIFPCPTLERIISVYKHKRI